MNSAFASSYKLLLSSISELELQKDSFVLRPGIDFSREELTDIIEKLNKLA